MNNGKRVEKKRGKESGKSIKYVHEKIKAKMMLRC
jgi:hypothetical protein